ncbi:hypothetical protein ACKVWC_006672 [Pyricularia oryzae]
MLSQARPRTCTLLRRHVYALSPKDSSQWQRTNVWQLAVPNRVESARWVHQPFRRVKGLRPPPPPSILSASLRDLSRLEVTSNVVATPRHVSDMLQTISQLPPSPHPVLYLNSEGANLCRDGDISVVAIFVEPKRHVYLVDVQELGEQAFNTTGSGTSLKQILESADVPKVFFDVRDDASALFGIYGIRLQGVQDVQLMENANREEWTRRFLHGLRRCMELDAPVVEEAQREAWLETKEKGLALFNGEDGGSWELFRQRPLPQICNEYCVHQVKWLPLIYAAYTRRFSKMIRGQEWRTKTAVESNKRVEEAQTPSYESSSPKNVQGPWGGPHPNDSKWRQYITKLMEARAKEGETGIPSKKRGRYTVRRLRLEANADAEKRGTDGASTEPVVATA